MDSLSLIKKDLPTGFISAAVGEPYIVRDELYSSFKIENLLPAILDNKIFEYTKPAGYDPLVKFLEDKHQAPVIVSNGAKQACGSLFYAIKKIGKINIFMNKPWWSLFPPLIKIHGLNQTYISHDTKCAQLIVYPNNPAGGHDHLLNSDILSYSRELKIPTIHDCAYHNPIYLGEEILANKADVQVYTCSKLFGLSQLRIGYSVFYNTELYNDVIEYMETMTVGTSILSQIFALNLFQEIKNNPESTLKFENNCYNKLSNNRKLVNTINSNILDIDRDQTGMFLWAKCHDMKAFEDAKIAVVEGTPFGMSGYIRMNIALPPEQIADVVKRLNKVEL